MQSEKTLTPVPSNEDERLAALRQLHLLDTSPEERFDRLVRMAAHVFDVPMAYVSLVDANRQWFKSKCGLTASETPRDISFCAHAIMDDQPLVIPDAYEDERFASSPLVRGAPFIRFYAGYPMAVGGEHRVGTFCVADHQPRDFSAHDLALLKDLSAIVERELSMLNLIGMQQELLTTKNQLLKSQEQLGHDIADAAEYLQSLLPSRLEGPVTADWRYRPSAQLGGDGLGYRWLDEHSLIVYLLDVSGHGVGPALLSASLLNLLTAGSLAGADWRDPTSVLTALNTAFPMETQGFRYFTMWYGVYDVSKRELRYANGGHPPPVLATPAGNGRVTMQRLTHGQMVIGASADTHYTTEACAVPGGSSLFVFSDGAYEFGSCGPEDFGLCDLIDVLEQQVRPNALALDGVMDRLKSFNGGDEFTDDLSLLQLLFH